MEVINEGGLVKLWAEGVKVEDQAREQLKRVARLPFIHKWVAAMPDCHWGMGATIGSVIPTEDVIVPAAVGVDIGCGIAGWKTELKFSDIRTQDRPTLRADLERNIPHGRSHNGGPGDRGAWGDWHDMPKFAKHAWVEDLDDGYNKVLETTPVHRANNALHLGTLGSGNHFIEYAADQDGFVWILVHSGSRGPGAAIANYWMKQAKELMKRYWVPLEDPHLAYLVQGTSEFNAYIKAMFWAQRFAAANRQSMLQAARTILQLYASSEVSILEKVETPHNFVAKERHWDKDVWVTRKGACRAKVGDRIVIPGSMGERSYVVNGKGNRESFESCSHGAGRAMSRTQALKTFDLSHHVRKTAHVECRKDAGVLDETVGSYKDIEAVMAAQSDLVEVTHSLRAFVNVKG